MYESCEMLIGMRFRENSTVYSICKNPPVQKPQENNDIAETQHV